MPSHFKRSFRSLLTAIVSLLALLLLASAAFGFQVSSAFGAHGRAHARDRAGAGWRYHSLAAGQAKAFRLRAGTSGFARALHVYIGAGNTAERLIAGLYSSAHGHPGSLLSAGSAATPAPASAAGAWATVSIAPVKLVPGRRYWLAILGEGGRLRYRDRASGGCLNETSARGNLSALPSAWRTGAIHYDCPALAYITPAVSPAPAPSLEPVSPVQPTLAIPVVEPTAPTPAVEPVTPSPSPPPSPPLPPAPTNEAPPLIGGGAEEGETLQASPGVWTGSPTSYEYQWEDCNEAGEECSEIAGATGQSYELGKSDVGRTVVVVVTASNAGGSTPAVSRPTALVAAELTVPTNEAPPSVRGATLVGEQLSANPGTWTGHPSTYTYHWEDCNEVGEECSEIAGATGQSYELLAGDVKHTVRVVVVASNASGDSSPASSEATATIVAKPPAPPTNEAPPTIGGSAVEGQTLTANHGTWTGSPTSYAYQWEDCNAAGGSCSPIGAATSPSYKLGADDVKHTVLVVVSASNAGGSGKASSAATGKVLPLAPKNTAPPAISGSAVEGDTLSASTGTWTGSPTSYAYQWQDCNTAGEGCSNVSGATSSTYKPASGDVGHTVRVVVTASNEGGSAKASSAATAPVAAIPPPPPPPPSPQIYVSQAGAGSGSGESCADAHSLGWLNDGGHWGTGSGKVAPGTTVDLCGTITEPVETQGSGTAGKPVTISFTSGSKIAMSGNGCPGNGCIDIQGGSEYITITSVAGYKGQIENTERSYSREGEEGPGTTGVLCDGGCRHDTVENLEIGPLYVAERGDVVGNTEIKGISIVNEGGDPEYDTIRNDYLHDQGWAVNVQNGESSGHIYVENNVFYRLTHGLALGAKLNGSSSIGPEVFAHNRFYGNINWEDGASDTNHVDGVHCFAEESHLAHYTGLYLYDNYITTEGANTTGPIFLEGSNGHTPCSDKTSNVWIFNNVLTGNTCCGLAGAFTGEVHTYNNTEIGEGSGFEETCETFNSDTKEGRPLTVQDRVFKNNVVTSCKNLISAERYLVGANGMEHNLWANSSNGNEVFACEHGEVETGGEAREAFSPSSLGSWASCMGQPETESRYAGSAKLKTAGEAQAPLGEPESGSEAIGHGKNLSSLCPSTPEEALCKNIKGEPRPSTNTWNIGAY